MGMLRIEDAERLQVGRITFCIMLTCLFLFLGLLIL